MADQERPIGFWLKLVDQMVDDQFGASFEEHGVTRRQWQMMNLLVDGPATQKQLSDGLRPFFPAVEASLFAAFPAFRLLRFKVPYSTRSTAPSRFCS